MGIAATMGFVIAKATQPLAARPRDAAGVLRWAPSTTYELGEQVISPSNDLMAANVAHKSSRAYPSDASKWTVRSAARRRDAVGLLASNNGVIGDGVTDDGAALNVLLAKAATHGVPVVLTPLSIVHTTVGIMIPSHTRLYGNGSTIKCGITSSIYTPTIGIIDVTDVVIDNLVVNGQKANYASSSEHQHCIGMRTSTDILIRDCTLTYGAGDGITIAGDNATTWSERITLDNVKCLYNNRNGLSIQAGKVIRIRGGSYSYNAGTAPEAGIDVEPNNLADPIEDIAITDVLMEHNDAFGFLINLRPGHTAKQEGIRLTSCSMRSNGQSGANAWTSYHLTFTDCEFNDNKYGISLGDYVKHLTVRGGVVLRNTVCGIGAFPATLDDFVVSGMRILDNVGIGIRLSSTGTRFLITGNIIGNDGTSNTTTGIATQSSALSYVSIVNNHIRGLSTALSLGDNAATRVNTGNAT